MSLKIVLLIWSLMALCSLAEGSFVTQEQFEKFVSEIKELRTENQHFNIKFQDQAALIQQLTTMNQKQDVLIQKQITMNQQQDVLIQKQTTMNQQLASKVDELNQSLAELQSPWLTKHDTPSGNLEQNITIEERVTILEAEMGYVLEELSEIDSDVSELDESVDFLFDEQFLQDQRILALEQDTDQLDDQVESLQITTLTLDNRVSILEENGGGGSDNSSVVELEVRVTELEDVTAEQEERIIDNTQSIEVLESNVTQSLDIRVTILEYDVADQEDWIVANTQSIEELQSTDVDLDARVSVLEESGNGSSGNDTVAFYAVLTSYSTISGGTPVSFNLILEDTNNSYNSSTGTFTVPPGGDGLYYFSTYLLVNLNEYGRFNIQVNGVILCTAYGDDTHNGGDLQQATCSGLASLIEGDEVQVIYRGGADTTPLVVSTLYYYNGFSGFRFQSN